MNTLTRRETEILKLVSKGLSNREIAGMLGVEVCTIKVHLQNTFRKLEVRNRTQAAVLYYRKDWGRVQK